MGVNNLPRVAARQCTGRELNSRPIDRESNALATMLPSHPNSFILAWKWFILASVLGTSCYKCYTGVISSGQVLSAMTQFCLLMFITRINVYNVWWHIFNFIFFSYCILYSVFSVPYGAVQWVNITVLSMAAAAVTLVICKQPWTSCQPTVCSGQLNLLPSAGQEMSSWLRAMRWKPSVVGWGGDMSGSRGGGGMCSLQVQLFANTGNGWPHHVLRV